MPRAAGYFVTGTGTGVGKTFISCALARRARELGAHCVLGFKPIETGCTREGGARDGRLVGADQQLLCDAAGNWQSGLLRGVYQFEPPVAPLVAAEHAGVEIDVDRIVATVASATVDVVVVEGAGGWRVPITPQIDMAELARRIGLPIIIVAEATLGTINHTLLTIEAVERDRQVIAGVVLSRRPNNPLDPVLDNAKRISSRWPGPVMVVSEPTDLDPLVVAIVPRGTSGG
ncbi:MAG TPA: dethiobiotin synthase [Kofleriaceae bacterium]|jgi:dethiobiotin synthetase|nr:dethiobiotin synthase [Kofleriaceae bacterium]